MGYIGESCALLAACSFVTSSTIFSQVVKSCSPTLLNLYKGFTSISLNLITLFLFFDTIFPQESVRNYLILIISGVLGVAIGDIAYYVALENIGARQSILLETLAPTFTGIISYFYFGSTISFLGWIGILLTCFGIVLVVNEQEKPKDIEKDIELVLISNEQQINQYVKINPSFDEEIYNTSQGFYDKYKKKIIGIAGGVTFTICQSFGMILSSDAMRSGNFSSLQSALIRVIAGNIGTYIILKIQGQRIQKPCQTQKDYIIFFSTCILSSYIGIWLQQLSLIYTSPEVSQTIMGTAPLISLVISWFKGEQMKSEYFVGSSIAVLGVVLIIWT